MFKFLLFFIFLNQSLLLDEGLWVLSLHFYLLTRRFVLTASLPTLTKHVSHHQISFLAWLGHWKRKQKLVVTYNWKQWRCIFIETRKHPNSL